MKITALSFYSQEIRGNLMFSNIRFTLNLLTNILILLALRTKCVMFMKAI